jgi:hypothetical protein
MDGRTKKRGGLKVDGRTKKRGGLRQNNTTFKIRLSHDWNSSAAQMKPTSFNFFALKFRVARWFVIKPEI